MWEIVDDFKYFELVGEINCPYLQNQDGSTFRQVGRGREFQQYFLLKTSSDEFEFSTSRWNADGSELQPNYLMQITRPEEETLLKKYAFEIESALLTYPEDKALVGDFPVQNVYFQLFRFYSEQLTAQDCQLDSERLPCSCTDYTLKFVISTVDHRHCHLFSFSDKCGEFRFSGTQWNKAHQKLQSCFVIGADEELGKKDSPILRHASAIEASVLMYFSENPIPEQVLVKEVNFLRRTHKSALFTAQEFKTTEF